MHEQQLSTIRLYFTGLITLIIWSMLVWQFTHNGVPVHYLFRNPDLPALSNWWGGLLLPLLSWIMMGRIKQRILKSPSKSVSKITKNIVVSFVISLSYGALLSFCFLSGYSEVSAVLFPSILFFAIFFKVYKEEFLLGFILSMSITFGALLSITFGSIIALLSFIVYFVMQFIWSRVKNLTAAKQVS